MTDRDERRAICEVESVPESEIDLILKKYYDEDGSYKFEGQTAVEIADELF